MAARTVPTAQVAAPAGLVLTFAAAPADGLRIANDARTYLYVKNAGSPSINVTLKKGVSTWGLLDLSDKIVAVAGGATTRFGPFEPGQFNQSADAGYVYIDFSAVTDITYAVAQQ